MRAPCMIWAVLLLGACGAAPPATPFATPQLRGTVEAAYDVVERLVPGSKSHFDLSIVDGCAGVPSNTPCFSTANRKDGTVVVKGP